MSEQLPFVSVVVPVRNEENFVEGCLCLIRASTYPADRMEVLVCDGMSTDGTRAIVQRMAAEANGFPIRLVDNPQGRRASGLNAGIRSAQGEVVLRVDARTRIEPDYISRCVQTLLRTGADNVGGTRRPLSSSSKQRAIGLAMSHPFGVGNAPHRRRPSGPAESVYLGCFRREIFDRIGLFDEEAPVLTEDSDINQRIRDAGGSVYLDTSIVVSQVPRDSFCGLCSLYYGYGAMRAGFALKHHRLTSWRQLVPPLFVVTAALLASTWWASRWALAGILTLAGIYAVTLIAVSASLAIRERHWQLLPRIAACFPCMHIAWGLGFWRRLVQRPQPGTYWPH